MWDMSYISNAGFHTTEFDRCIFACILLWIQLESNETLEERTGSALYWSV